MNQAAAVPQFTYHQWPGGEIPPLQYKSRRYSQPTVPTRQLIPHYDIPSSVASLAPPTSRDTAAPLPFMWDPLNWDYFCYEPETTCFVYYKSGRLYYDEAKRQHYLAPAPQYLTFAQSYPEYRTYQTGEVMFFDSRRQDWYRYDMQNRRIIWRDQRWWPLPGKLQPPSLAGSTTATKAKRSTKPAAPEADPLEAPLYRALPINSPPKSTASKEPKKLRLKREEQPRIVEVTPDDITTNVSSNLSDEIVYETYERPRERKKKARVAETDIVMLSDDDDDYGVIYKVPASSRRGHGKRRHKAGIYGVEELAAKSKFGHVRLFVG